MQKDWKEFEGGPNKSFRNRIRVTLSPKGMILLNRIAYQALEEPQAVVLLFDENERTIGLKPADPTRQNAFPIKQKDQYHNRTIATNSFCRHYNLIPTRTILFNNAEVDNDGVLRLELRETIAVGGTRRPTRAKV